MHFTHVSEMLELRTLPGVSLCWEFRVRILLPLGSCSLTVGVSIEDDCSASTSSLDLTYRLRPPTGVIQIQGLKHSKCLPLFMKLLTSILVIMRE
ncbi:hypothetical protein KP509_22G034600 [Ceratopteris richardii]|uniref:Uncharacterized protein n=1 Tax=Ceratopteris richardii TaxID=49495 RepID=A0A8T2S6K6_CERRI|nr:hypothetical protein KP509_22G034600 [Ceratopteris richardii]